MSEHGGAEHLPWKRLAAAIVEQAVWDYRRVRALGGIEAVRAKDRKRAKQLDRRRRWREAARKRDLKGKAVTTVEPAVEHEEQGLSAMDAESALSFIAGKACEQLCLFVGVEVEGLRDKLASEGHGV